MSSFVMLTIIPAAISFLFSLLQKKTKFANLSFMKQQILIGISFGALAVLFTEYGIESGDAVLNIRDSAPLCAGLLFGGPAGIIAGIIGGAYRWFCVYWGGGMFTRLACSIACVVAGLNGAVCRKTIFRNQLPGCFFGFAIAVGTEVLHMMLILMTNVNNMSEAFQFVSNCASIMILCNGIAVFLADLAVERKPFQKIERPIPLLHSFSIGLIVCFAAMFALSFLVTYTVNIAISDAEAEELLKRNLDDVIEILEEDGITKTITTWRVGQSGGIIVCDKDGNVLSMARDGNNIYQAIEGDVVFSSTYINMDVDIDVTLEPNTFYLTTINEEDVYCEYRFAGEYYVFAYMMAEEADLSSYVTFYMMLFAEIMIYLAVFFVVYQIVRRTMTDHLHEVNDGLTEITDGNLNTVIDIRNSKEFSELSDHINSTVDTLKDHIKDAEQRIERELEMAHEIQKTAVPFIFPPFPKRKDIDIYALMNTAKEVGGDFYDFYFTDDAHFAFLIADVSGKGIPAAMFMMASKTLIKGLAERGKPVDEVFMETNEKLCEGNDAGMFVTAWMGVVNLENGHLQYVNAGHNPPLLCRRGETYEYLREKPNFILAGMEDSQYKKRELYLNPGDTIYLYTDGITEAENMEHKLYGEERLARILHKASEFMPMDLCHIVEDDVQKFTGEAPQSDDMTMLAFRLNFIHSSNAIIVHPSMASLDEVTKFVDEKLTAFNVSSSVRNKVQITVDEIFSNIQNYGNATRAEIHFGFEDEQLGLTFIDNGDPFDPTKAQSPDTTLPVEERQIGGLGIFLVKKLSSSCTYQYKDGNNQLNVIFNLKDQEEKR